MIEVRDAVVDYGGFTAVKGVSFSVQDGEFFTLLGPSGCGKTTTLRAIAGFENLASGQIILNGRDIAPLAPEERDMGFVFQNYALFPSMTVFDNIAFGLRIRHVKKSEITGQVNDMARMIGITEHLNKKISQISGGQQQRVAIARALITHPCLLLMDEPLSNLDAKLRVTMRSEIKRIQKELGIVAIYVTHDQEEAMAISDRIAVFNNGLIEQTGTPQEIYLHPLTEFTAKFVGDINHLRGECVDAVNRHSLLKMEESAFVRPERLHLSSGGERIPEGMYSFPARITAREFLGACVKTVMTVQGQEIRALTVEPDSFDVGQTVQVSFSPGDVIRLE